MIPCVAPGTSPPLRVAANEMDSADLLSLARAGDSVAFGELCREYEPRLFRQACLLSSDDAAAEDLAQDTFIAAWKSLARFNGSCQFFTWLCAILLNLHRQRERKNWFWRIITSTPRPDASSRLAKNELEQIPDDCLTASASLEAQERQAHIRALLSRLPRKQREVLFLRFFADESLTGIAGALNCSVGTVKSRLFNGLDKLRKIAAKELEP
jgi:RNA polymerase sigma-70 factor (ECF subfamily)